MLEKGTSIKIPKSFAKNATYLIHYKLILKIKIQNMPLKGIFSVILNLNTTVQGGD